MVEPLGVSIALPRPEGGEASPSSYPRNPSVLALIRRVEGLGAGRVIGDVDHRDDLGTVRPHQTLDALANRHLGQATTLAATFEADGRATIDGIVWPV